MPRKKILIIAPYGFNDRMVNFIEFVSARLLARGGWDVTALVQSDTGISSKETVCGITVYRYARTSEGLRLLLPLLVRGRPAIIHAHNLRNNRVGIVGAILSRLLRIRLICTEYGLLHDHYLTDFRDDPLNHETHPERIVHSLIELARHIVAVPRRWRYFASSYLFHWPLAHADHLVFVSEHNLPIARELRLPPATYLPQTSDEFRWQVVDSDVPDVHESELAARIAALSGPTVLFIGQMKRRKGWDVLLRAIPHTDPSAIAQFVFVSSSTTSERAEFTELVDSLNVRDRVVFLGKVPSNTLLHELYERATIVAVPSRYEGFGLVPLEAFEVGRPVVASDVVALSEYLKDGDNALLVPPEDPRALGAALDRVARDESLRRTLVDGGARTLAQLRSHEYEQQWLSFYDKQLGR